MTDKLVMEVSRDGWTGGLQLSISQKDENGAGHGYRIAGPKFNGSGELLLSRKLDERDAAEIRRYLDAVFPLPALAFKLDDGSGIDLICPDCGGTLWLTDDETPTLADVITAAGAHDCDEDGDDD